MDLDLDTDDDIIKTKNLSALDVTCRLIISRYNLYQRENFFQVFNNPKCFYQSYQYLEILGLNQAASIQQLLDGPFEKYKDTWSTLSYLGLDCRENAQRILTNPQSFEQDFDGLIALRSAYESIVKEMEANQLKAHGLAGGNPIKFKGETVSVATSVGILHIQ
ncbi:hypothetical protein AVI51_07945 [Piscirickettsia salmonis]|uniref:hypothetical protein n=1 Tax=Piscirickettsia salmonis TaxID=1238 RepID=UPI0002EB71A8|nr:hypothetical protein [Piscirickettsia salmonis]APS50796.1 hypothetical protein AVI50_08035 [Piscirickettsia salmonis]APS54000.1 hypothetical protein AVI51_07945 [Piscirickettsia salmonis]APS57073.1 hypothetical protein AVI52_07340 [Piscirickettsia salmonis]PEQ16035.1 hypothetical protein X973_09640 [Piscirickettsia salmonis]